MENEKSTILKYQYGTLQFVLLIYSISALLSSALFISLKLAGVNTEVSWMTINIFTLIVLVELITFWAMFRQVKKHSEKFNKLFLTTI